MNCEVVVVVWPNAYCGIGRFRTAGMANFLQANVCVTPWQQG